MTKFRVVGRRNTYSRSPECAVANFEESEEDAFYEEWNRLGDEGFTCWVYIRSDAGIWEEQS